jgi:hypothetical protein
VRTSRRLLILAAILAAVLSLAPAALASTSPVHLAGVPDWNRVVCGRDWLPVDMGRGDYFDVLNSQSGNTCIDAERHHLTLALESWAPGPRWQYPHILSGASWGRYTCYDGRSGTSRGSRCMRYPVQEKRDGDPVTSIRYFQAETSGNTGTYDIWFDKRDLAPTAYRQDDGAEIMIWLGHPGLNVWAQWYAWVGGREYGVMNWVMDHNGASWNFVVYWPLTPVTFLPPTHLNLFFADAIRHGQLSADWYLTSISAGSEINDPGNPHDGSWGFDISQYSLTGVR